MIPEVLFSPKDIGIDQGGIPDMIKQISTQKVPTVFESMLFNNIIVGGGNTKIPGFKNRLQFELEANGRLPDTAKYVKIYETE